MKSYLSNSNPLVRYYAAKALFTFGDQSGYSTLLDLVNNGKPMVHFGSDLRSNAIETLAKYRQVDASPAIYKLYGTVDDSQPTGRDLRASVRVALMMLSPKLADPLMAQGYFRDVLAIQDYGLLNDQNYLPQIRASFQDSTKLEIKIAAAWAIATMTNDPSAVDYLAQTAQSMLKEKHSSFEMRHMVKDLGTIQDPRMKPLLEQALDCDDPTVVQCAIVNLLYNQGGSEKAKEVLADALNLKRMNLPWDFVCQVAAQFKNERKINEAGGHYAQRDLTESWQLWTGDRRNWPIYNWIDDYVLKLNDKK